jgi:hypothetical protein
MIRSVVVVVSLAALSAACATEVAEEEETATEERGEPRDETEAQRRMPTFPGRTGTAGSR